MQSSAHLQADLKQEAAIAILLIAPKWRANGGASFETYVRIYAWRAMQELCAKQSGPVAKSMCGSKFEGTQYGAAAAEASDHGQCPDAHLERKDADDIVCDFVNRRAERFTGKGKLGIRTIKNVLHDLLSGDTCLEVGRRYGCSKQYVSMLAAQAEIS